MAPPREIYRRVAAEPLQDIKNLRKVLSAAIIFTYNLDMLTVTTPYAKDCHFLTIKFKDMYKYNAMVFQILSTSKVKLCCPRYLLDALKVKRGTP